MPWVKIVEIVFLFSLKAGHYKKSGRTPKLFFCISLHYLPISFHPSNSHYRRNRMSGQIDPQQKWEEEEKRIPLCTTHNFIVIDIRSTRPAQKSVRVWNPSCDNCPKVCSENIESSLCEKWKINYLAHDALLDLK